MATRRSAFWSSGIMTSTSDEIREEYQRARRDFDEARAPDWISYPGAAGAISTHELSAWLDFEIANAIADSGPPPELCIRVEVLCCLRTALDHYRGRTVS